MFDDKYKEAFEDMKLSDQFKKGLASVMKDTKSARVPRTKLVLATVLGVLIVSTTFVFATNHVTKGKLFDNWFGTEETTAVESETTATEVTPTPTQSATPTPTQAAIPTLTPTPTAIPTSTPTPLPTPTTAPVVTKPTVTVKQEGDGIRVTWTAVTNTTDFQYYKIVASIGCSSPRYPDNGYATYITDSKTTSYYIANGSSYNSGDFCNFSGGTTYYFSVTTCYTDTKYVGNAVSATMPGSPYVEPTCAPANLGNTPTVTATVGTKDGVSGVWITWTPIVDSSSGFQFYKVVASPNCSSPRYPDNGYATYITESGTTSYFVATGSGYNGGDVGTFTSGTTYYFSITTCLNDNARLAGNAVAVVMP